MRVSQNIAYGVKESSFCSQVLPSLLKMERNAFGVSLPCLPLFEALTETPSWVPELRKSIYSWKESEAAMQRELPKPGWLLKLSTLSAYEVTCAYTGLNENVLAFPQECQYSTADIICWPVTKVSLSSANKYSYFHGRVSTPLNHEFGVFTATNIFKDVLQL